MDVARKSELGFPKMGYTTVTYVIAGERNFSTQGIV